MLGLFFLSCGAVLGGPEPVDVNGIGAWRGDGFVDLPGLLRRDVASDAALAAAELELLRAVNESYAQQAANPPWTTLPEFLAWGGIDELLASSIREYFSGKGVAPPLIDGGLTPLTRAIYNRDAGANAFAFLASLTAELKHHSVRTGNSDLVARLLAASGAQLRLNTTVRAVSGGSAADDDNEAAATFTVTSTDAAGAENDECYDVVIVAAPLERAAINVAGLASAPPPGHDLDRGFTDWHVTVVQAAEVDRAQFAPFFAPSSGAPLPKVLLTTANASEGSGGVPWVVVQPLGKHGKVPDNSTEGAGVWMVYTDAPATDAVLSAIFVNVTHTFRQYWPYTFARLNPVPVQPPPAGGAPGGDRGAAAEPLLQPVILAPGFINANAVESLASAMEISVFGARNAARLAVAHLAKKKKEKEKRRRRGAQQQPPQPPQPPQGGRVAVVGAGIGGAAASYYVAQMLAGAGQPDPTIVVFERGAEVGGRLKHIEFGAPGKRVKVEVGGAAWASCNRYMSELANDVGINVTSR